MITPVSDDEDEDDGLSVVDGDKSTRQLAKEATDSACVKKRTATPIADSKVSDKRLKTRDVPIKEIIGLSTFRIPRIKNSSKFTKEERPPHLQDDEIFDAMSIDAVTSQLGQWTHTKAIQENNAIKAKKNDKNKQ